MQTIRADHAAQDKVFGSVKMSAPVSFPAKAPGTQDPRIHISCVIDNEPRFRMQAWNWLLSLRAVNTACKVFIHYLPNALSEPMQAEFAKLGAHLVEINPFGEDHARFCNKINQLKSESLLDADYVILSDADIVFLEDPAKLIEPGRFRAKQVDMANPPIEMLRELFLRAGMPAQPETVTLTMLPTDVTAKTNFNGGLYVMPIKMARDLATIWPVHARFALEQAAFLGKYAHHADQLGMALALVDLNAEISVLPDAANLPTHSPAELLSRIPAQNISALHYHWRLNNHGLPLPTGVPWIDAGVVKSHELLTQQRRKSFANDIFWDFRYQHFPELGSGLGSRGEVLAYKQNLVRPYLDEMGACTVLDVGCGDLEFFAPFELENYTGIDLSERALSIARTKRPDWTFKARRIDEIDSAGFDYVFCIDVLIHQSNPDGAQALLKDLLRVARKGVFFSIHSEAIARSGISFDSSNLRDFTAALPDVSGLYLIGSYRDTSLYFAEKHGGNTTATSECSLQQRVQDRSNAPT